MNKGINMKKIKLLIISFFLLKVNISLSNGGYFGEGNLGTGQLKIQNSRNISIEEENLDIWLYRGYAKVQVIYKMRNYGEESSIKLGFPSLISDNSGYKPPKQEIIDYKIHEKTNELFSETKELSSMYKLSKMNYEPILLHERYASESKEKHPKIGFYYSDILFRKNETKIITITYTSNYFFTQDFSSMWVSFSKSTFRYLLSFGSTWKGSIKKGRATIYSENIQSEINIMPKNRFIQNKYIYMWKFRNLEPKRQDDLTITINTKIQKEWIPRENDRNAVLFTLNKQNLLYTVKPKTISASSYLQNYLPSKILDNDLKTAWVEGQDNDGIGETITFSFYKKSKIYKIGIVPGYNKNKELFYKNNRVSQIEILFDGKLVKNVEIPDGYTSYQYFKDPLTYANLYHSYNSYYFIDIPINTPKVKEVTLKILGIYEGSEYRDTCISEVLFLEKLIEKPIPYRK